jgi:hypothetical protein
MILPEYPSETEADKVQSWRLEQLLRAGYSLSLAERLAARSWHEVDLHLAVELVKRGCKPAVAALILL